MISKDIVYKMGWGPLQDNRNRDMSLAWKVCIQKLSVEYSHKRNQHDCIV